MPAGSRIGGSRIGGRPAAIGTCACKHRRCAARQQRQLQVIFRLAQPGSQSRIDSTAAAWQQQQQRLQPHMAHLALRTQPHQPPAAPLQKTQHTAFRPVEPNTKCAPSKACAHMVHLALPNQVPELCVRHVLQLLGPPANMRSADAFSRIQLVFKHRVGHPLRLLTPSA